MFIDDTASIGVLEMRAKARRLKAEHGLDLLIIDYIQLMQGRGRFESRQAEIASISRSLKGLAKELNVPIVALSQLSRASETRADHRPQLSDLRESGALEQDADVVMFIYREEQYRDADGNPNQDAEGTAEIIIGKQRNGPVGTAKLAFIKEHTRFENLAPGSGEAGLRSGMRLVASVMLPTRRVVRRAGRMLVARPCSEPTRGAAGQRVRRFLAATPVSVIRVARVTSGASVRLTTVVNIIP